MYRGDEKRTHEVVGRLVQVFGLRLVGGENGVGFGAENSGADWQTFHAEGEQHAFEDRAWGSGRLV